MYNKIHVDAIVNESAPDPEIAGQERVKPRGYTPPCESKKGFLFDFFTYID
jgi:hypothetical protein